MRSLLPRVALLAIVALCFLQPAVLAQGDADPEAADRAAAEAEAAAQAQADAQAQAEMDAEIAEAEAAAAASAAKDEEATAASETEPAPEEPEEDPAAVAAAQAAAEAAEEARGKEKEKIMAEQARIQELSEKAKASEAAENKEKADAKARHAAETGTQAIDEIARATELAVAGEKATWLDFGDIMLQKALSAAEAAGMSAEHREHMMSDERGITEGKRRLMRANHTKHETCEYKCTAAGTVAVADALHNASAHSDMCGAPGLKVNEDFPFDKCCHQHDVCYSTCNTNKNQCDLDFIFCMNSTCNYIAPNDECRHAAVELFDDTIGLSDGACTMYVGAQSKACTCVSPKGDEL